MYLRLFRRRSSDFLFLLVCEGGNERRVMCLNTADSGTAVGHARELVQQMGKDPERVPILVEGCSLRGTGVVDPGSCASRLTALA